MSTDVRIPMSTRTRILTNMDMPTVMSIRTGIGPRIPILTKTGTKARRTPASPGIPRAPRVRAKPY